MPASSDEKCYKCGSEDSVLVTADGYAICVSCLPEDADYLKIGRMSKDDIEALMSKKKGNDKSEKPKQEKCDACDLCGETDELYKTSDGKFVCSYCLDFIGLPHMDQSITLEIVQKLTDDRKKASPDSVPDKPKARAAPKPAESRPKTEKAAPVKDMPQCFVCKNPCQRHAISMDGRIVCGECMKEFKVSSTQVPNLTLTQIKNLNKKKPAAKKPVKITKTQTKKAVSLVKKLFK